MNHCVYTSLSVSYLFSFYDSENPFLHGNKHLALLLFFALVSPVFLFCLYSKVSTSFKHFYLECLAKILWTKQVLSVEKFLPNQKKRYDISDSFLNDNRWNFKSHFSKDNLQICEMVVALLGFTLFKVRKWAVLDCEKLFKLLTLFILTTKKTDFVSLVLYWVECKKPTFILHNPAAYHDFKIMLRIGGEQEKWW